MLCGIFLSLRFLPVVADSLLRSLSAVLHALLFVVGLVELLFGRGWVSGVVVAFAEDFGMVVVVAVVAVVWCRVSLAWLVFRGEVLGMLGLLLEL